MGDSEGAHYRKTKNRHHGNQKRKVSHKQKAPLLRRGGSVGESQLKDRTSYKQNVSLLRRGYGRGRTPAEGQLQKEGANKAMKPASSSSSSPEASDDPFDFSLDAPKTKVVVRGLPPSLSEKAFTDSIPPHLYVLFNWISFIPGKPSKKSSTPSRAYIDFKNPEDVFKFFEEFNGHSFVNEKGTKYRAVVEYAPHQQVPKPFPEEDTQEGSITEDPEYLEFLDGLAKPVQLLPSAEVQLERKEAEKRSNLAGAKEAVVVTPLMEHVRHNRALKAKNVFLASKKKFASQGSSTLANSIVPSKQTADILSADAKCAASAVKPSVKLTYVPRRLHEANQCKEVSLDAKRKAVFESREKVVTREKGLAETVQSDQKYRASRQSVGSCGQIRKDGKLQHADMGKRSKQSNGVRSYEKQVWVAKSASGS